MANNLIQTVDVSVSKKKFKSELDIFLKRKEAQRARGVILLDAIFPNIELIFFATQLNPSPAVFSVRINFENYDIEPPSVLFIHPFSGEPLKIGQVLTHFNKNNGINPQGGLIMQPLLQSETPDSNPFLCIPGVREYHNHPFHTGDSWLLHRKIGGEGTLGYIIDKLFDYGISAISTFNIQVALSIPQLQLGLDLNKLPE